MTLTEYFAQTDPVVKPRVELTAGEVTIHTRLAQLGMSSMSIEGLRYTYVVKDNSEIVWTQDEDGNPKGISCFVVPRSNYSTL